MSALPPVLVDRRGFLGLVGAGAILTLAACAPAAGGGGGTASTTLRWAAGSQPWSWDPVVQGSGFQFNQLSLVYASLTEIDEDGVVQPGLAESWEYDEAGTSVTFHLREGLVFTDGTPLDAAAVAAYILRAKGQEDSAIAGDLTSIADAVADSDTDVRLTLTQVDHQIPLLLGRRVAQITSPAVAPDDLTTAPVGAGPFRVVELVPESHVHLERNPDFYRADEIHIERVELSWGIEASSLVSALQTGVYDFADIPAAQAQAAEAAGLDVTVHPGFNASNLSVNGTKTPFDDPIVLEAARYAIDRQELVDTLTFGYGAPTSQPFPEGYVAWSADVEDPWPFDADRARELLEGAGYGPGDLAVELVVSTDEPQHEVLQRQLGAVGIDVSIRVDPNWNEPFFGKQLALSTYGTTGRESPVQTLTAHFGEAGPLNLSGVASPEFLAAVQVARETPLDSPDYPANLQAATAAGVRTTSTIFTFSLPNLFAKRGLSDLPQIPGQIHWTGVRLEA